MLWTLFSTYHPGSVSESCYQSNCHVEALDTRQLHPPTATRHQHLSVPSGAAFTPRWAAVPVATGLRQTWPLSANVFHTCSIFDLSDIPLYSLLFLICTFLCCIPFWHTAQDESNWKPCHYAVRVPAEFAFLLGQHLPKQLGIKPWQLSSIMPAHRSAAPVAFICHFSSTELLGSGSLHPVISCAFVAD